MVLSGKNKMVIIDTTQNIFAATFIITKLLSEKNELDKFQFVELLCSNDTERVRAVTKRTAPSTHCQRRLAAKVQFIEQLDFTTKSVILSEAAEWAAKSKNLRTDSAENVVILPGSFDSLRSLRMTGAFEKHPIPIY